jgi:hypothetical protein
MGNKGAILNGLLEKVVLKTLSRLGYDATGNLRVTNTPTGTQPVSGSVTVSGTVTVASTTAIVAGNQTAGSTQAVAQTNFQQSFRRNLVVS